MPKNALITLKNRKNRPALGAPPPDPLWLRRPRASIQDPVLSLHHYSMHF